MVAMLIGSRALEYWSTDFKCRDDADWDVICDETTAKLFEGRVDIHDINKINNRDIAVNYTTPYKIVYVQDVPMNLCNPLGLYILKRSHAWRERDFDKTITHLHTLLSSARLFMNAEDSRLLEERIKLTKAELGHRAPSLNKTNAAFFDDPVTKVYEHDWLHELAAYTDSPMYTKMKRNAEMAWCEKDMWEAFSLKEKLDCTAEEVYVIACERFQIPTNWDGRYKRSYMAALKKVCTTLTSGWFRDFAIDNYPQLVEKFDVNKFEDIKQKIEKGINDGSVRYN